jgi:hypothetical protein
MKVCKIYSGETDQDICPLCGEDCIEKNASIEPAGGQEANPTAKPAEKKTPALNKMLVPKNKKKKG